MAGLQPGAFDAFTSYLALASANGAGIAPNNLGDPDLKPEVSKNLKLDLTQVYLRISLIWNLHIGIELQLMHCMLDSFPCRWI